MTDDFDKKVQLIEEEKNDRGQGEEADNSGYFAEDEELYDCSQGAIALERVNRLYMVLGWISAVMALFTTPFAAIAGIIFGANLNKQRQRAGNVIIIANVVGALINIIFNAVLLFYTLNMLGIYY
ncbi:MAG TPA: hypothetical protein DEF39_09685 [Hungateiclostridium thermocellum]|jgi:uncharacterized membrane protein|uniref:Uncharacterized protein n=2 Tax=Acetivibrio thermocellus TaxID=1515 RepID=A3DJ03_ACET2|nr:hypothetical protein [Acetivibrio thermocellus]ABN53932.1 hypothetical protein Cthe_2733 [Acetivibrio thermocellus ATCC 27405]ADU73413.1 hypothetical protein Clo1313_0322 [Acetivibrio thermocellus DSM 1313]ALX07335.1 hypothetical protein AD2_00327 [Acetivibrio thermocellus AD2]ANV75073.1 hypothetical protein LQRI_0326 [Acetivibrio thermocellus DSM 2360]EIC04198.1 hypothetical protein YSBL_2072 [Acetivibrio thermocellus YS]